MSYPVWVAVKLTYTAPADIDGEPEDVRELSMQQLMEAVTQTAQLGEQTLVQVRAAGLSRLGDDWPESDEAAEAAELIVRFKALLTAVNRLQQAEN
jgi:hypothetical protein